MRSIRAVWLLVPLLNTLQQVFLKQSAAAIADTPAHWLDQLFGSPWFGLAIAAEIACFWIWMTVLSELDLSAAFPLSAVSYVLIMGVAWLAFGEPITLLQIAGSLLILAGTWLIANGTARAKSIQRCSVFGKNHAPSKRCELDALPSTVQESKHLPFAVRTSWHRD
jgi:multidrug transporter EmrE-like cation transporter